MKVLLKSYEECKNIDGSLWGIPEDAFRKIAGRCHTATPYIKGSHSIQINQWVVRAEFIARVSFMRFFTEEGKLYVY